MYGRSTLEIEAVPYIIPAVTAGGPVAMVPDWLVTLRSRWKGARGIGSVDDFTLVHSYSNLSGSNLHKKRSDEAFLVVITPHTRDRLT